MIGVHPKALLEFDRLQADLRAASGRRSPATPTRYRFYVDKLAEGIATLAAAFAPEPVIVRMSDFKSNEYANLIGGERYEPHEENPMLGFRGASRYVSELFRPALSWNAARCKYVARRNGTHQCRDHGAVRAHAAGSGARLSNCWRLTGLSGATTGSNSS